MRPRRGGQGRFIRLWGLRPPGASRCCARASKSRRRTLSGLWGLRPPGASRCCARASLRTPSRPHPPLDGASPDAGLSASERFAPLTFARDGQRHRVSTPRRYSYRYRRRSECGQHVAGGGGGKECEARHERSNDWPQGGAAPITRKPFWRGSYLVLGSATSRKPSPKRLMARTGAAMQRPGAIICQGYSSK